MQLSLSVIVRLVCPNYCWVTMAFCLRKDSNCPSLVWLVRCEDHVGDLVIKACVLALCIACSWLSRAHHITVNTIGMFTEFDSDVLAALPAWHLVVPEVSIEVERFIELPKVVVEIGGGKFTTFGIANAEVILFALELVSPVDSTAVVFWPRFIYFFLARQGFRPRFCQLLLNRAMGQSKHGECHEACFSNVHHYCECV